MHFGEYEEAFQRLLVRTSIWCYPDFILAKGRSLGFASTATNYTPCQTRFRFGFMTLVT